MTTFRDRYGLELTVHVRLTTLEAIQKFCGFNAFKPETWSVIADSPRQQCRLLYIVTRSAQQQDALADGKWDQEECEAFVATMHMQSLEDGLSVFLNELRDILPTRQGLLVAEIQERMARLQEQMEAHARLIMWTVNPMKMA